MSVSLGKGRGGNVGQGPPVGLPLLSSILLKVWKCEILWQSKDYTVPETLVI